MVIQEKVSTHVNVFLDRPEWIRLPWLTLQRIVNGLKVEPQ